jgi:hypothetical protein
VGKRDAIDVIMEVIISLSFWGLIVLFVIWLPSLLATRRTVLRILGYVICSAISIPFIIFLVTVLSHPGGATAGAEATKIINDLRRLRGAAISFREDHGRPPLPGEEASLDLYMDRTLVTVERPEYAKVTLIGGLSGDIGYPRQYVGVELRPKIGKKEIQRKLAQKAVDVGILGEVPSDGEEMPLYKSGLNVYMEIPLK